MLYPETSKSPTVEVYDHGKQYPIYDITLHAADLRDYFDEPTPDKCDALMQAIIERMTDEWALNDLIHDELLPEIGY